MRDGQGRLEAVEMAIKEEEMEANEKWKKQRVWREREWLRVGRRLRRRARAVAK